MESKRIKLLRDADHGDAKTLSVYTERWPTLRAGDEVEVVGCESNWYGLFLRVKSDRSEYTYDISSWAFNSEDVQTFAKHFMTYGHK